MALVDLPASPGPRAVAWQLLDFGGTLRGALGGASQRVNRLGSRWAVSVSLPALTPAQARSWSAALTSGLRNGVRWRVRQVGTPVGAPGSVLVAGAGQSGLALDVDGLTAGYFVKAGQWLSVTTSSSSYLYQAAATVQADGSGVATLALEPALRVEPADNDPVALAAPVIEGLLADVPGWSLGPNRLASGFSFTIEEMR